MIMLAITFADDAGVMGLPHNVVSGSGDAAPAGEGGVGGGRSTGVLAKAARTPTASDWRTKRTTLAVCSLCSCGVRGCMTPPGDSGRAPPLGGMLKHRIHNGDDGRPLVGGGTCTGNGRVGVAMRGADEVRTIGSGASCGASSAHSSCVVASGCFVGRGTSVLVRRVLPSPPPSFLPSPRPLPRPSPPPPLPRPRPPRPRPPRPRPPPPPRGYSIPCRVHEGKYGYNRPELTPGNDAY